MQLLELFPTLVGLFELPGFEEIAQHWREEVGRALQERQLSSAAARQPQRQTGDRLHERPALANMTEFFLTCAEQYMSAQKYRRGLTLRMQCCWATVAFRDDRLEMHQHPNSFLSGAFYLDVDSEAEPILFRDPRPQNRIFDLGVEEDLRINRKYYPIEPKNGLLILFPAWLEHKVGPNRTDVPRVSIAFNMTIHGEVGFTERLSRAAL